MTPHDPSWPDSKINAHYLAMPNPGRCCIGTQVSGVYQWYIPLFVYCARRAWPEYEIAVYVAGRLELPEALWDGVCGCTPRLEAPPLCHAGQEGLVTAAERFLVEPKAWKSADYCLITDVDILMVPESPYLVDQHMMSLRRFGLDCYDNYVSDYWQGQPRLPGVHFVTREWWDVTRDARETEHKRLLEKGPDCYCHDEVMLARIVCESGLSLNDKRKVSALHGLHLGDWRRRIQTKRRHPGLSAADSALVRELDADPKWNELMDVCGPNLPVFRETWDLLRRGGV